MTVFPATNKIYFICRKEKLAQSILVFEGAIIGTILSCNSGFLRTTLFQEMLFTETFQNSHLPLLKIVASLNSNFQELYLKELPLLIMVNVSGMCASRNVGFQKGWLQGVIYSFQEWTLLGMISFKNCRLQECSVLGVFASKNGRI